ncbi:unnamed protein product [Coregonus sp. 'balchen']|nr:unnamed protein product [Coregonus sp. 'balchen']
MLSKAVKTCFSGVKNVCRGGQVLSTANTRLQHSQPQEGDAPPSNRPETSSAKTLMDIGTRRIFNDDHDMFRESVRRFWTEEVVPYHKEWEKAGMVSRELWQKAGEQGLLGILTPEEHGCTLTALAQASPSTLRFACPTSAKTAAHGISLFLVEKGMPGFQAGKKLEKIGLMAQDTAELFFEDVRLPASALLGQVNKGFYYLMNELPQERLLIADMAIASSEFMFEETRNYVTQRKAFGKTIAHLQTVQHKLAELKTEICVGRSFLDNCLQLHSEKRLDSQTASMAKYCLFLVEKGMPGFQAGKKLEKIGLMAQVNKGFYYLMNELPQERLLIADMAIASSEFMFEETRNYVTQRKAFGKTIAHLQTVQHKLAELKTEICVGRSFVDNCLQLHSEKRLDSQTASMAKYWAFVDSRIQPIYGGTNEIMKELIARSIVSQK